jgi:hypothetical protein
MDYNNNRFIAEMANDSLPVEKFIFYLKQDHAFLKESCFFLLRLRDAVVDASLKTWPTSKYGRSGDADAKATVSIFRVIRRGY